MSGITGTIASSGGVININSGGTLTMANSQIKLASGVSISLESGANLVLDNSTLSGTGITVPSGATLTLKGSSSVSGSASGLGVGAQAKLSLTGGSFTASGGYAVTAFATDDNVGRLLETGYNYYDNDGKVENTSVQHLGENGSVTVKSGTSTGVDVAILEVGVKSTTYTTDDYDTPFDALKQAFANANGKTATLTLLTSVEADELITISGENTNLTLKMVDGAVLSGRDQTETYDDKEIPRGMIRVSSGSTLTLVSGTIDCKLSTDNTSVISLSYSNFNMTGGQINCKCSGSSQSVVSAFSDLENVYKVTLSGGELNLTGTGADDENMACLLKNVI